MRSALALALLLASIRFLEAVGTDSHNFPHIVESSNPETTYSFVMSHQDPPLTGTIPTEIGLFTRLESKTQFALTGNKINGSVPTQIGALSWLEGGVMLGSNRMTGSLPSELGNMGLTGDVSDDGAGGLWIQNNYFSSTLPTQLGRFEQLGNTSSEKYAFRLSGNSISGSLPTEIGKLRMMAQQFRIEANLFSWRLPSELGQFQEEFRKFRISNNKFCSDIPTELSAITSTWENYQFSYNSLGSPCPTECVAGTFQDTGEPLLEGEVCQKCSAGRSSDDMASECYDCPAGKTSEEGNATCWDCPAGGMSVGNSSCFACDAGKTSSLGASECTECAAGTFGEATGSMYSCGNCKGALYACVACSVGKYQQYIGQTDCIDCSPGSVSANSYTGCADCGSGHFVQSDGTNETCSPCSAGKYASVAVDGNCTPCGEGTYSAEGAASCNSCRPGEYATDDETDVDGTGIRFEATTCRTCAAGTISDAASWRCTACLEGYFQPQNGSDECLKCTSEVGHSSAHTTVGEGQSSCDICIEDYYRKDDECVSCETNDLEGLEKCTQGTRLNFLPISEGWYRFASDDTELYECSGDNWENCRGGSGTGDELCVNGSHGALCSLCKRDFFLDTSRKKCKPCAGRTEIELYMAPVIAIICCLAFVFALRSRPVTKWFQRHQKWLPTFGEKFILFVVTMQIIFILKENHNSVGGNEMSEPYDSFVGALSVVDLDISRMSRPRLQCFASSHWGHFGGLVLVTSIAPVLYILVALAVMVWTRTHTRTPSETSSTWRKVNIFFIRALLLSYPAISREICRSFRCKEYDGGDAGSGPKLLQADLSVRCDSLGAMRFSQYEALVVYAGACGLVYSLGIPSFLLIKLCLARRTLNPAGYEDWTRAVRSRKKMKALLADPITQLALPFKPRYYWFEIFSLGRRFALTSLVITFDEKGPTMVYVVLTLTLFHILEREWAPMIDPFMCNFSHALSWQVMMAVTYMTFLDAEFLNDDDGGAVWMSWGLLIYNVTLFGVIGRSAIVAIREQMNKDTKLRLLRSQLLTDKREDKEKFGVAWQHLVETGGPGDEKQLLDTLAGLASKTALPNGKQPTPKHSSKLADVDALLAEADELAPAFHATLRALTERVGGRYQEGPNKSRARAIEKIENDYMGDHTKLVDVVRASSIFVTFLELTHAVEALMADGCALVVRAKDRFNKPTDFGYKDLLLNVKLEGSDHVGELQLHLQSIIDIKPACHRTYALMRAVGWEDDNKEDDDEETGDQEDGEEGGEQAGVPEEVGNQEEGRDTTNFMSMDNPMHAGRAGGAGDVEMTPS